MPYLKNRSRQSGILKFVANGRNTRITILSNMKQFQYVGKCSIPGFRFNLAQRINGYFTVQTTGAFYLHSVTVHLNSDRNILCMDAVITVNKCIQYSLPDCFSGIFRYISSFSFIIYNCFCTAVSHYKVNSIFQHIRNCTCYTGIVYEAFVIAAKLTDLRTRYNNSSYTKLRKICLWIF